MQGSCLLLGANRAPAIIIVLAATQEEPKEEEAGQDSVGDGVVWCKTCNDW